jgi:hypothetical protein
MKRRASRRPAALRVLVATDGSRSARGALATALAFPWPPDTRVRGVVVSDPHRGGKASPHMRQAFADASIASQAPRGPLSHGDGPRPS